MTRASSVDPLSSWKALNAALLKADEATCLELLMRELAGQKRRAFVKRIHHRHNKMRARRELRELLEEK